MKKIIGFSVSEDDSKIHREIHKKRISGGRVEKVASTKFRNDIIQVIIEPKCLK